MAVRPSHLGTQMLLFGGLVGSLLPDIDHPRSWIGRRIPMISIPLSALVGHRGITHSLLAILTTAFVGIMGLTRWGMDLGQWAPLVAGLCLGYASHLFGDWASNSGIPLLWPLPKRFRSPVVFCTGGIEERIMAIAMWIGSAYMYLHNHYFAASLAKEAINRAKRDAAVQIPGPFEEAALLR